jgi:hypothetical protein
MLVCNVGNCDKVVHHVCYANILMLLDPGSRLPTLVMLLFKNHLTTLPPRMSNMLS